MPAGCYSAASTDGTASRRSRLSGTNEAATVVTVPPSAASAAAATSGPSETESSAAVSATPSAAPKGTPVRWYDAPHGLNRAAYRDAFAWLARKLPIEGPPVRGAATA